MKRILLTLMIMVCAAGWKAAAQSFDLRPQHQQKKSDKKDTERLAKLLDANDVAGLRELLREEPTLVNANSLMFKTAGGAKRSVPLFFETVVRALDGRSPVDMCKAVIDAGCELDVVYEGMTPIYLVMDYIATHPKDQCERAVNVLRAYAKRKDFDANKRYRSEMPPMNYLMRRNYYFLGGKFSKEYIPDEVLTTLIAHGASVTSYTKEGASLMTFAIDTDNKYLQTYFIEHGVNLRHNDVEGNDAVHHAIEQGDLALLKKMVSNGGVNIDINSFHNDTKEVSKYPELYNYLADVCGGKAQSYQDLVLFRKRFPDKHSLVQQKYETLAQGELDNCQKFADVIVVAGRYPDLSKMTDPKKKAIYQRDSKRLNDIFQDVLDVARSANLQKAITHDGFVAEFISTYSSYDPDVQSTIAKRINDFYDVHNGVIFRNNYVYHGRNDGFLSRLFDLDNPYFNMKLAKSHRDMLIKAKNIAQFSTDTDFQPYYKVAYPELEEKLSQLINNINEQIAIYNKDAEEYNAKLARNRAYDEQRRAEKEAKEKEAKEKEKRIRDAADEDLSTIGITYTTGDWEQGFLDSFFMKAKHESTLKMKVKYSDGSEGVIIKYPKTDNYLPSRGEGWFFDDTYETLYDAIAAEYFFQHDVKRYKGLD